MMKAKVMLAAIAALGWAGAAQAELVCDQCPFLGIGFSSYVGSYWTGDRGTFVNPDVAAELAPYPGATGADNYYVFDLNETADVSIAIAATNGSRFTVPAWAVEIYTDLGTWCVYRVCEWPTIDFNTPPPLSIEAVNPRSVGGEVRLTPGRYVVRLALVFAANQHPSYKGTLRVRAVGL